MKKFVKKLKGKKVLSLVLAAIMLATTFNMALPMLKLDASAVEYDADGNIVIGGITQKRVVGVADPANPTYPATYAQYATDFLVTADGIRCSEPTNLVIPGLSAEDDFIVQGLSYYKGQDWIIVSSYHKTGAMPSMLFALDAATGDFKAAFEIWNKDGSNNYDHGGGLAFSEYNFYYSGDDSDKEDGDGNGDADQIAYAPLSYFDNPVDSDGDGIYEVVIQGAVDLPEMNTAATAYVCYDEGILWAGNFYEDSTGAGNYNQTVISSPAQYNSMIYGYKLAGNSSQEEWEYLCGKYNNLLNVAVASGTGSNNEANLTWSAYRNSDSVNVYGDITAPTASVGEFIGNFGSVNLKEGVNYTIEFISTNRNSDVYLFAPSGGHTNIKQSSQTTITQLEDGRYHYKMNFTAGLKPTGADSSWPTTQSTDGTYTGTYTLRFDQDAIQAGETRAFEMTDMRIYQTNEYGTERIFNIGSAGYPSYCVAVHTDFEDIQYAVVDKGRIYLSRSWGTGKNDETIGSIIGSIGDTPDWSTLTIGDIDLSDPGDVTITHNTVDGGTRTTQAHLLGYDNSTSYDLMPMSEGLCFIEDNLYISFEGASNKYMNEYAWSTENLTNTGNCDYPIDVIWKLDPYALKSEKRPNKDQTDHYEKINSLSEIKSDEEYMIVFESDKKDPVTQQNILYAFNADGGFKDYNLSKSNSGAVSGYDGMVCHPITQYSRNGDKIYLTNPDVDDKESIRWKINHVSGSNYNIRNTELYFSTYRNLYFDANTISMMTDNTSELASIVLHESGNGKGGFWFESSGNFLWCNDSLTNNYTPKINRYYAENGATTPMYSGLSEQAGTVHCNALFAGGSNIIGGLVETGADTYYADGVFYIYKRVLDPYAEQQESRVFTDMTATVESDGTYTVNLETYALASMQYKILNDDRPTDFIFVLDASSSMESNSDTGMTGWKRYSSLNTLSLESAAGTTAGDDTGGGEYTGNIYYRHSDGNYCRMSVIVGSRGDEGNWLIHKYYKDVWLYYTHPDGTKYWLQNGSWVASASQPSAYSARAYGNSDSARNEATIYTGPHYEQTTLTRLDAMKLSVDNLIDKISSEATSTGLNHRVSIVQYGSDSDESYFNTGMYKNDTNFVQFSGSNTISAADYASTFFDVTDATSLQKLKYQVIEGIESPTDKDADTFSNHGFEMAKGIIQNSDSDYSATGARNACVIMITDGIPGKGSGDATSATNTANAAIAQAKTVKEAGAYIFTAQLGSNTMDGFNMSDYMDYTSSEYVNAESLTVPGDRNIKDIEYRKDFALGGSFDLNSFVTTLFDNAQANSKYAITQLDGNSVIQQKLSEVFDASTAEEPDAVVLDGHYDSIGRLTFGTDPVDTDVNAVMSSDTITISGFNYSTEYISKEKPGKKLVVTVRGLLPKPDVEFVNTSINNDTYTGIYQTVDDMNNTSAEKDLAFKHFPAEYFNIPEYTYVLDYGLKLLDTDINGTLCSVSDTISKQSTYNSKSDNGALEITNNNLDLFYSITPDAFTAEEIEDGTAERSGYSLIQRDDGTYDWFKIKVVPASNIYYEETTFDVTNGSNPDWTEETDGTSLTHRDLPAEGDVVGFDNAYDNNNKYSNGTILATTVDKSNKRSDTASVTFTGNGFDLVSACGPNTGVQLVAIKQGGKTIKSYIVDTYYDGELVSDSNPLVSQVPIVNWRTDTFGEYTVETKGYYLSNAGALRTSGIKNNLIDTGLVMNSADLEASIDVEKILADEGMASEDVEVIWFDDNSILNGGTGAKATKKAARDGSTVTSLKTYVDGFRIYNPLGTDSSDYADGEKNASYVNVIENLAPVGDVIDGIGFISGTLEEGVNLSFSNYETVGPQGEFYLKANQAITFKVKVNPGDKVMLGLRAVNGATTINVNNVKNIAINSATEMFYDISNCIGEVTADNTEVQITVQNGAGILALNQVKFSGGAKVNTNNPAVRSLARSGEATQEYSNIFLPLTAEDLTEVENTFAAKEAVDGIVKNGVVIPLVEEENVTPDDTTTPDVPGDDTNNDNNDDTNTDSVEKEEFSIFSLLELLISLIEKILHSAFGTGSLF